MFWYLATPYSKFPGGLNEAFILAVRTTGLLIRQGVPVFSPIAHTHPIAMECGMDPLDHTIWLPADMPILECAKGLIMLKGKSWEISYGMEEERKAFAAAGKPIVWMDVGVVPAELLTS